MLHFQYGLYTALGVDPPPDADGKIRAFRGGPDYDVERILVFDSWDPRWHELEHSTSAMKLSDPWSSSGVAVLS